MAFAPNALAQEAEPSPSAQHLHRMDVRPPVVLAPSLRELAQVMQGEDAPEWSEAEMLRRLARLYQYQSEILQAQADDDAEQVERLFDLATADLHGLLQQQDEVGQTERFRELYRSFVTEYEHVYGEADTLALPEGSIFALRADLFAELDREPLLEDVTFPEPALTGTEVPLTMNELVERSIAYLVRRPERTVIPWLSRADTYFPMVEEIFEEEGVPDELKYLAMIESGLNPTAKSWAAANGMWQFIAATGSRYDMAVTRYLDQRLDPETATRAAARHLRDLYDYYGEDWHLALAGYNCSPRCIKRGLRKARAKGIADPSFFDIYPYLPRETRNYVPMFIAAALVSSNPEAYGIERPEQGVRYEYDHVPVAGGLALAALAPLAGTDLATLKALNPELRRAVTPPSRGVYYLRVPIGRGESFMEALADLPEEARPREATEHTVRRGENLGAIARRYGVRVSALKQVNGMSGTTIHPGQSLTIPGTERAIPAPLELAEAQPRRVRYGVRSVRPLSVTRPQREALVEATTPEPATPVRTASATTPRPPAARAAAPERPATQVRYRIRRGDTLGKIAQRYRVRVSDLRGWNDLSGNRIRAGQHLTIYTDGRRAEASAAPASAAAQSVTHRVRRGDTLSAIARRYGVSVSNLRDWNSLSGSSIRAGQRLTVHAKPAATSGPVAYTVRRGDSLYTIARAHSVTVRDLKTWNSLSGNTIKPGQRLQINR